MMQDNMKPWKIQALDPNHTWPFFWSYLLENYL